MKTEHKIKKVAKSRVGLLVDVHPATGQVSNKIVQALNNPKFKARTISGISKETHLTRTVVVNAIRSDKFLANTVKVVPVRTKDGRALVTTKERFFKEASLKEKFIDFFASKRAEIEDGE